MPTKTVSLEDAMGAARAPVEFAPSKPNIQPVVPEEDGPEAILRRIEESQGVTFDADQRETALDDIRNGATFDFKGEKVWKAPPQDQPKRKKIVSLADAMGEKDDGQHPLYSAPEEEQNWYDPVTRAASAGWQKIHDRIKKDIDPNFTPEGMVRVPLTADEVAADEKLRQSSPLAFTGLVRDTPKTKLIPDPDAEIKWRQRIAADPSAAKDLPKNLKHLAPQAQIAGFIDNLENPLKLMLEDSMPANFVSMLVNMPAIDQQKFMKAQKAIMQENISRNPDKFPKVSVEAARVEIAKREKDKDPGVIQAWKDLYSAAEDDPKRFGALLINSIIADPEMLLIPGGTGAEMLGQTAKLARGVATTSKMVKLADRMVDAGSVGAAMNIAITAQDKLAQNVPLKYEELRDAAALGAAIGGPLGAIFGHGAKANLLDLDAERLKGTLEETLRNRAAYDVEIEAAMQDDWRPELDTPMQKRIQDMLGIQGTKDREAAIKERRAQVKSSFKNESDYADYLKFKAEERIARRQQIVKERADRARREQAEAAKRQAAAQAGEAQFPVETSRSEIEAAQSQGLEVAPRSASETQVLEALAKPGHLRTAEDLAAIRAFRNQSGKVDPELALRMGLGAAGATAGAVYAGQDHRIAGSIIGGLTGFLAPGGGRVVDRMRQSGAISGDGLPISLVTKAGKLLSGKDAAVQRAEDFALVKRAREGDSKAFEKLYAENRGRLVAYAKKLLGNRATSLGMDAEGVVQEAFIRAYKSLDSFREDGNANFQTWMHKLVENEGLNALRNSNRRGSEVSIDRPVEAGGSLIDKVSGENMRAGVMPDAEAGNLTKSAESLMDDLETPEAAAIRQELEAQVSAAIAKMTPKMREVIIKKEIELLDDAEIAKAMGESLGNVRVMATRGKQAIKDHLENYWKKQQVKGPKNQRGVASREMLGTLAIGGAAATAGAAMFPKDKVKGALAGVMLAGLGLGRGSRGKFKSNQIGAIRNPFEGEWAKNTHEDLATHLSGIDNVDNSAPKEQFHWASRAVKNYLNKYAGTKEDPLKDIVLPQVADPGITWGEAFDYVYRYNDKSPDRYGGASSNNPKLYGELKKQLGIPEESNKEIFWLRSTVIKDYLNHVGDYILLNVPPERLKQYDLVRAVRETVAWDAENARKIDKARQLSMKDMTVYKEYPDGMKWVKLDNPGQFANESDNMGHSVRGYEPVNPKSGDFKRGIDILTRRLREEHLTPEVRANLEEALRKHEESFNAHSDWIEASGESGHPEYGVGTGGWEAIKNGSAEVYSLRDVEGKSLATIEVEHVKPGLKYDGDAEPAVVDHSTITQIKGPRNSKPSAEAIPKIQDFVKSREWANVDDLHNADLQKVDLREGFSQPEVYDFDNNIQPREVLQHMGVDPDGVHYLDPKDIHKAYKELGATEDPRFPWKQRGYGDTDLLKYMALAGFGATAGLAAGAYFGDSKDPKKSPFVRAAAGAILTTGLVAGRKAIAKGASEIGVPLSTRILYKAPAIHRKLSTFYRTTKELTHERLTKTDAFKDALGKYSKDVRSVIARALNNGDAVVTRRVLEELKDSKLIAGYKEVRSVLDSLRDQLKALGRIVPTDGEYFPRMVKDKEGLFAAIGKEDASQIQTAIEHANIDSMRKNGRPLNQLEESALINNMLFGKKKSSQPGWAKARGIEDIKPEWLQYYHDPIESLHTYIRSATQDIEQAKLFGEYGRNIKKGKLEFLDLDHSINNLLAEEIKSGRMTNEQAHDVAKDIKSLFGPGQQGEPKFIQDVKNLTNIGLLGNFWSAASQISDIGMSVFLHDLRPTIESVIRQVSGKRILTAKEMGLLDTISEEFSSTRATAKWVNRFFKASLFAGMDRVGKETALNAAIIKGFGWAKTESGQLRLANKYAESFGKDFPKLVSDLKAGKITPLTKDFAWMELSRSQPISPMELPKFHADHPNMRTYLYLKSFTIKQLDILHRTARDEFSKGNYAKGVYLLGGAATIMGMAGATTAMIKEWMLHPTQFPKMPGAMDVALNMFKNLGLSEYQKDHFFGVSKEQAAQRRKEGDKFARPVKAEPGMTTLQYFLPPARIWDSLVRGDKSAYRYLVPGVGPYVAEKFKQAEEEKEKKK